MTTSLRNLAQMPRLARLAGRILVAVMAVVLLAPLASANCFQDFRNPMPAPKVPNAVSAAEPESMTMASSDSVVIPIAPATQSTLGGITGLWNVTFSSGGQVVDVAFDAWHSDGTEILNDYTNPIEGNVCLGVWVQTGTRTYTLKHPSWSFDTGGNLLGTVVIHENVQLSADGNSSKGTYTYDIYDTNGNFLEAFTGTLSATRIKAS